MAEWLAILLGGALFGFVSRKRPFFVGLLGVVLLTGLPMLVWPALTETANAMLIGWLVVMAVCLLWKFLHFTEKSLS